MRKEILAGLAEIEKQYNVKVLYAVESGSRAWGFASKTSDYDVRFIYVRPYDWYLRIDEQRDVIECFEKETLLDYAGWDLKKTLKLFRKGNPHLLEWLYSPIIYSDNYGLADRLRSIAKDSFNPKSSLYHYMHMSRRNFREYLEPDQVRIKKYFYVLRTIFACHWILKHGTQPPVLYMEVFEAMDLPHNLRAEIERLYQLRTTMEEDERIEKSETVNSYILEQFDLLQEHAENIQALPSLTGDMDKIFLETLYRAWGKQGIDSVTF